MFRFFLNNENKLNKEDQHHLLNVIRVRVGEHIELVDTYSQVAEYEIVSLSPFSYKKIKDICSDSELNRDVTLFFALAKGDKNELVIQKCTELGVKRIVFTPSVRSVVKLDESQITSKLTRYQMVAKEAAMQSHRTVVPEIVILKKFNDIEHYACEVNFVAYEDECMKTKPNFSLVLESNKPIGVFVGSEGGIDTKEIDDLKSINFKSISLGNRILRCETAAIYALSVISYLLEK